MNDGYLFFLPLVAFLTIVFVSVRYVVIDDHSKNRCRFTFLAIAVADVASFQYIKSGIQSIDLLLFLAGPAAVSVLLIDGGVTLTTFMARRWKGRCAALARD
ncbi:MAG TPA: hypothetical protein VGO11_26930 [Chthoniobacteraceae bacterium]|jgi:hypothetical protein|nr:hypothetical protein [Chthoniobacteraceae bacterium]